MQETWQERLKQELMRQYVHNTQEWLEINISTSGSLNLTVVSDSFSETSISSRNEQILTFLRQSKVSLNPGFFSLNTIKEAESLGLFSPLPANASSIHTWQDLALQAANPQNQTHTREPHVPRTVTFYSFKGGVGRTTALTHIAWILAMRGRKVVAIDLDLEAPGLSTAFNLNPKPRHGIVDYFYERSYLPENVEPNILITEIFGEVNIKNALGRLFVVPAGSLDLDYISKVDDLRANAAVNSGEDLWSTFSRDIQDQLKPDILLVDSRTGINQWGALSLFQAADEAIIFLFPNEQNRQGIDLILKSLQAIQGLSLNFVFTPVPDTTDATLTKVKKIWQSLNENIQYKINDDEIDENIDSETSENDSILDNSQAEIVEPLIVPYLSLIASAESYPVTALLSYYNRIANLIDEETDELKRKSVLTAPEQRWLIIKSLQFSEVKASDPQQDLSSLFQRTTDFEKFLDDTTCLVRGRKGTGKTALYWLLLKHENVAQQLSHGRLDSTVCYSAHGEAPNKSRPSREEFQVISQNLESSGGAWESFWRAYLLLRAVQEQCFIFPKGKKGLKYASLKEAIKGLNSDNWQYEHTKALIRLSTDSELRLLSIDILSEIDEQARKKSNTLWFLYDDLDEDFVEKGEVRQKALTGLFQFLQACDARRLASIRFKIFLREDIWNRLNFDNKSHFNGRDLLLQWTRIDFLRLALRQAIQSKDFKNLVDRFSPIESIDQANEESIDRALELLWGSRRRRGSRSKYVSRWVYERLTDSSGTTFPRSLGILLKGAKERELEYEGQSSIKPPTDRLLRGASLEMGLKDASDQRCSSIREEYPMLKKFFDSLKDAQSLLLKEELQEIWKNSVQNFIENFDEFTDFLNEVGLAQWREKDQRYKFADIYVYGFQMIRRGTV